jgi:hypothetical protein
MQIEGLNLQTYGANAEQVARRMYIQLFRQKSGDVIQAPANVSVTTAVASLVGLHARVHFVHAWVGVCTRIARARGLFQLFADEDANEDRAIQCQRYRKLTYHSNDRTT